MRVEEFPGGGSVGRSVLSEGLRTEANDEAALLAPGGVCLVRFGVRAFPAPATEKKCGLGTNPTIVTSIARVRNLEGLGVGAALLRPRRLLLPQILTTKKKNTGTNWRPWYKKTKSHYHDY